jgi:hypothetical protein
MRNLNNKGLHNLYCFPDIIRVMHLRTLGWLGLVSSNEESAELHTKFWLDNNKISCKKKIKLILKWMETRVRTGFFWLRIGPSDGLL